MPLPTGRNKARRPVPWRAGTTMLARSWPSSLLQQRPRRPITRMRSWISAMTSFGQRKWRGIRKAEKAGRRARLSSFDLLLTFAVLSAALISTAWSQDPSCEIKPYAACSGVDLGSMDLSNADLAVARFEDANLETAQLVRADLSGAYLTDAILRRANLTDANLQGARLKNANLEAAILRRASLADARLDGANLRDVDAQKARFEGASLRNTDLSDSDLRGAVFTGARLSGANLEGANITGARFKGSEWQPAADLSGAIWINGVMCDSGSVGTCNQFAPQSDGLTLEDSSGLILRRAPIG
ncbi:pentapeptide repeat-containing protein [Ferruginivarius sediminum]|uniref:Pentapeptide repeat-containing protein n=2 Tax=Ferruginivarius sediminum TaxID=2661937 RepID=A0A369T7Y8_9PROT|nr:pentapeptide repeat-containing protein [Ferruginivarius sediminum]